MTKLKLGAQKIWEIEKYAGQGLPIAAIAKLLRIKTKDRVRFMEDERVLDAWERGRWAAWAAVAQALIEKAKAGDVRAIQLYLRAQAGWQMNHDVAPDAPQVTIYLPDNGRMEHVLPPSDL